MGLGQYQAVYEYMSDCVHGDLYEIEHVQRVLCNCLVIAESEKKIDVQVVILAALLHDIGKADSARDHALVGSRKSYDFLLEKGYPENVARRVAECILTHSYKSGGLPQSREAEILFDADKLDLTGAIGTARAVEHCVRAGEALYTLDKTIFPDVGHARKAPSLHREYSKKLKNLPKVLFTAAARKMAKKRQRAMDDFFAHLMRDVERTYARGEKLLRMRTELQ